ncbi:hypothetical protein QUF79_09215 [Fictibacillus enclensis]|uniref:hypothetical protein n=2 Tax=Fictibacillus enclensis TaxID=1017270 RepID=UPI0024BF178E|nr:hypothetical protein [Fictibacillus enclensis]MDM5198195.1 hypothetical protein [Fictibacillus enclensis]WHY73764.1 hypothetical protein QNH15_07585 [Fictibacillus enclensis]
MKKLTLSLATGTLLISCFIMLLYHTANHSIHKPTPYKERVYFSELLLTKQIQHTYNKISYLSSAHQIKNIPVFRSEFNDIDFRSLRVLASNVPDPKITKDISNIQQLQHLVKNDNQPRAVVYLYRILSDLANQSSLYGFSYTYEGKETYKIDQLLQRHRVN